MFRGLLPLYGLMYWQIWQVEWEEPMKDFVAPKTEARTHYVTSTTPLVSCALFGIVLNPKLTITQTIKNLYYAHLLFCFL